MQLISFALLHFAALLLIATSSYILGRRLTRSLNYYSALEQVPFCTALGLGVVAYLVFLLGLAGILYAPALVGVLVALQLVCYREWLDFARSLQEAARQMRTSLRLTVCAVLAALVVVVFYPA